MAELAGVNPPSPVTWAMAVTLLELDPTPVCRFASDPTHQCRSNTGQPIHGSQECYSETRAQLLAEATPADFTAVIESMVTGECGWCGGQNCPRHCSWCGKNAVTSGWRDGDEMNVCVEHQKFLRAGEL